MVVPPKWAQNLLLEALLWWEEQGGVSSPNVSLKWCRRDRQGSTGVAWSARGLIIVRAGTSRVSVKLVLLHELAHVLRPAEEGHTAGFWDTAWALYRWAKLPVRYCLGSECGYRKGAAVAYRRLLVKESHGPYD